MEQYTLEDDVTLPHESCYVERYGASEGAEGNISCRDFIFPVLKLKMYKIWQVLGMQYRSLPTMMLECLFLGVLTL
uniref:Pentatricopeptide repeat-containing protein n=1 Tax=Solanum tuberosum TaxID=4113 RepID=M1D4Z8_SOLTU